MINRTVAPFISTVGYLDQFRVLLIQISVFEKDLLYATDVPLGD